MRTDLLQHLSRRYAPRDIEPKWQRYWHERRIFSVANEDSSRPKFYVLDMFPYPSGTGLHVGHPRGYVASDIVARFQRMRGYQVLHPMGWDSFGLPTERQAERELIHPAEVTERNIARFRAQLKLLGLSYDWDREFATSDPRFFKWTQWIFLKLYERGLAYVAEVPVNWCSALNTVLANEEVSEGVYVETGDPVERRLMRQWILRITAYADRLLEDLGSLDWPESLKEMQRKWIGRSEGARIIFRVAESEDSFEVFTTRPDTLFGCTFCVLSPEHPLAVKLAAKNENGVLADYLVQATQKSERERISQSGLKKGAYAGANAINPVTGEQVPIWVSDFVLASYGTGAIFGCPAHDERDYAFARQFDLPIIEVVTGGCIEEGAYTGDGEHIHSQFLNGLKTAEAKERAIEWLERHGGGKREVQFALRDWLFSRQRYWGEPIPILSMPDGSLKPVPAEQLPVLLPSALPGPDSSNTELAPLGRAKSWVMTTDPETGSPARRETNTMPQWAGSSWYYLRFVDPANDQAPWSPEAERRWLPVDLYVGGAEHATLHLLYARFWHKFLFDLGYVSTPEPFQRLFNQGMVHSRSFRDDRGKYYYSSEVFERDGEWFVRETNRPLKSRVEKMSKSRNNGISPEEVVVENGADSLRIYEVFMGPLEESVIWQTDGVIGVRRFLDRVWRLFVRAGESDCLLSKTDRAELEQHLHQTVRKVTEDIQKLQLNTAVSQLMIFVNQATRKPGVPREILNAFVRLLAPFAPHLAEELWQALGHEDTIAFAPWPNYDPLKCASESVRIAIQVNGRLRGRLDLPRGCAEAQAYAAARENSTISRYLQGQQIAKTVFVADRLLNIITTSVSAG